MKIKKDTEIPSTVIFKSLRDDRVYWTGSEWSSDLNKAKVYTREEGVRKAIKKAAHPITTGFVPRKET